MSLGPASTRLLLALALGSSGACSSSKPPARQHDPAQARSPALRASVAPARSAAAPIPAPCGNARLDAGEECDDGNTAPADGCNAACRHEIVEITDGGYISADGRIRCDARPSKCLPFLELTRPPRNERAADVAIGEHHGNAVQTRDGKLFVQLPPSFELMPAPPEMQGHVRAVSSGKGQNGFCVLLDNNEVHCHGSVHGNIGYPKHAKQPREEWKPHWERLLLDGKRRVEQITGGMLQGCLVLEGGALQCWNATTEARQPGAARHLPLTDVPLGGRAVRSLTFGGAHFCALFQDGTVSCWGEGTHGELGYVDPKLNQCSDLLEDPSYRVPNFCHHRPSNHVVPLPAKAAAIYAGYTLSCAVLENGELRCWGDIGRAMSLRDGNEPRAWIDHVVQRVEPNAWRLKANPNTVWQTPLPLPKDCQPVDMRVAPDSYCALCSNGCLQCWGPASSHRAPWGDPAQPLTPTNECLEFR